mmetsp:Transcript_48247/g.104598  ORF Transcript_48247/g.104598 Transcript_48247/m.104598 type:complete len:157 (+) Transcript_48247:3-473(+)
MLLLLLSTALVHASARPHLKAGSAAMDSLCTLCLIALGGLSLAAALSQRQGGEIDDASNNTLATAGLILHLLPAVALVGTPIVTFTTSVTRKLIARHRKLALPVAVVGQFRRRMSSVVFYPELANGISKPDSEAAIELEMASSPGLEGDVAREVYC